jgi:hypothetical protein
MGEGEERAFHDGVRWRPARQRALLLVWCSFLEADDLSRGYLGKSFSISILSQDLAWKFVDTESYNVKKVEYGTFLSPSNAASYHRISLFICSIQPAM